MDPINHNTVLSEENQQICNASFSEVVLYNIVYFITVVKLFFESYFVN